MLKSMIFGRFIPGETVVHQMDARAKLLFVFFFVAIIFLANNSITYGILTILVLSIVMLSKIKLRVLLNGLKPVLLLVIFTFFLHVFFTKGGEVIFQYKFLEIEEEGLRQGIFISVRFLLLVIVTTILTLTTSPISITDGLELLLHPLKRWNLPVHELALMMSISLRFIPTLLDETDKIMKAQMARGSDMTSGPWKSRVKAVIPLLVPLFVSAFKRAEELAIAMEVRGYRGGEGRTRYRQLKWKLLDTSAMLLLAFVSVLLLFMRGS